QDDIVERLGMPKALRVITGFRRDNLAFEVRNCATRDLKFRVLKTQIKEALAQGGSAVVYAATRKNVERVAEELRAAYYHAGLPDAERTRAQENFLSGKAPILVATNAFGMGIDKRDVRLVAHFDI